MACYAGVAARTGLRLRAACPIRVLPSDHTAPGTRWLPAMTSSNACTIQSQSLSSMTRAGMSLMVWLACPATWHEDLVLLEQRDGDELAEQPFAWPPPPRSTTPSSRASAARRTRRRSSGPCRAPRAASRSAASCARERRAAAARPCARRSRSISPDSITSSVAMPAAIARSFFAKVEPCTTARSMRSNTFSKICLPRQHRADRHMAARQRLGQQHHVRLDVPVLDREEAPGAAEAGLDFVGDEQRAVSPAELGGALADSRAPAC